MVFAAIVERYELLTLFVLRPIVPVVVIVPPDSGDCAVIDVTVPPFALRLAICWALTAYDVPPCTTLRSDVPLRLVRTGRFVIVMLLMSQAQFVVSEYSHKAARPVRSP